PRRRRSSGVGPRDACILADYLDSFRSFLGNAAGAVEVYRAFLVWLYSAPAAPYLRQAAVPAGIDPWVYPVVLFGRLSGGKTLFTKISARSMLASGRWSPAVSSTATPRWDCASGSDRYRFSSTTWPVTNLPATIQTWCAPTRK